MKKITIFLYTFVFVFLYSYSIFTQEITGVDGKNWGSSYENVLDFYRDISQSEKTADTVEIINAIKDKEIIIKRDDIFYKFIFYKTPQDVIELYQKTKDVLLKSTNTKGVLFLVEVSFPSVESSFIQKKLESKYGMPIRQNNNTGESGFVFWSSTKGEIVQLKDIYKEKEYTSKLYYIAKEYNQVIAKDLDSFFFIKERESLHQLE